MVRKGLSREERQISRRKLLAAVGSAGLLAGCAGGDGASTDASDGSGGGQGGTEGSQDGSNHLREGADGSTHPILTPPPEGEPKDDTLTTTGIGGSPTGYQFNPWALGQGEHSWHLNRLVMWEQFANYDEAGDRFVNLLADEWEWDGEPGIGDFVIHLPDERAWSNGDDLTAEDVQIQFEIEKHLGPAGLGSTDIWSFIDSISADNDKTARFKLAGEYNPFIIEVAVLTRSTVAPRALYGDFYERLRDASDDETDSIIEEIVNFSVGPASDEGQEVVTHTAWKFSEATGQRLTMELRESGHELLDQYNFPSLEYVPMAQNPSMQALLSDELDLIMRWSTGDDEFFNNVPDHTDVWHFQEGRGEGVLFNFGEDSPFGRGNRKVRQAIAHVIDPEPVTVNSGSYRIPITDEEYAGGHITTGLSRPDFQKIRDFAEKNFIDYSSDERATELLEEAGFSKENGVWLDPDGSPFEPVGITDSGHPDWVAVGETITRQLQDFGIQAEQQPLESTQYENRFDSGDFQMVFGAETAREGRYPGAYFDYEMNWRTFGTPTGGGNPTGTLYPANDPVKIPPVGEPDAEPSEEVVPNEVLNELLHATEEEKIRDLTIQLAWIQNYDLQMIDLMDASQHAAITRDDWIWPPVDHMWGDQRAAQNIIYHCIRGGDVQAKTR